MVKVNNIGQKEYIMKVIGKTMQPMDKEE